MLTRVVDDVESLERFASGWDALAVACRRPRSTPALTLAWYRHAQPAGALIRVMIVTDDDDVIGVAPFSVVRTGFGLSRYDVAMPLLFGVEPLFAPGREESVASAIGSALASAVPVPDMVSLDSLPRASSVPRLVRDGWTRPQPTLVRRHFYPVPEVRFDDGGFEGWFQSRSKAFRKNFRSDQRKLVAAGFEYRLSVDAGDIIDRLPDFRRLYESRRASRGGAGPPFDDPFMAVVADAARELSGTGRFRLATMERPGEVIAADLIVSAGGQASAWFGGFDEAWAHLSPSFECIVSTIEHAAEVGDSVYDLGAGAESYKYQFTRDEVMFESSLLVRRGLRPFHSPVQLLPYRARQRLSRALGRVRRLARSR